MSKESNRQVVIKVNEQKTKVIGIKFYRNNLKKYEKEIIDFVEKTILPKIKNSSLVFRLRDIWISSIYTPRWRLRFYNDYTKEDKKLNIHWIFKDCFMDYSRFNKIDWLNNNFHKKDWDIWNIATYVLTGDELNQKILLEKPISHLKGAKKNKDMIVVHHRKIETKNKLFIEYPTLQDEDKNLQLQDWKGHILSHTLESLGRKQ